MSNYIQDLERRLKEKEKQLEELYKERNQQVHRENFGHLQSKINELSVDIATIKSRIDNYGKRGIVLPDHDNNIAVNRNK